MKFLRLAFSSSSVRRVAAAACAASLSLACAAADLGSNVVGRVGTESVTIDEIQSSLEKLDARQQAALAHDPALLNQAVRLLLVRKLVAQEAVDKKWDQTPAFATQIEKLREDMLVESYLQKLCEPPAGYPSEGELQKLYDANKDSLVAPRQYRLAQIFLAAPQGTESIVSDKPAAKVDEISSLIRQDGSNFSEIAKARSEEAASAARGGEIGWVAEPQIVPEIRTAINGLAAGGLTEAIKLQDGWHLIKVLEVRPAHSLALHEVRAQLAQRLRAERAKANRQAYLGKLVSENPVTLNELALSSALSSAVTTPAK